MKLNYEEIFNYQKSWHENKMLSEEQKNGLINLSNLLVKRAKENDCEIDNVSILYPEDCSNFDIFKDFASAMRAYVTVKEDGGSQINGWNLNNEVRVE